MATNKNFEVKNGLTIAGTERITSAGVITGSHAGSIASATTGTTQSASDNSTKIATTAYTDTAIANLADSAPSTLNTLNELAAALGDDANYATTTTAAIAAKAPLASPTLTGTLTVEPTAATGLTYAADGTNSYINFEANSVGDSVQLYAGQSSGGFFSIGTKNSSGSLSEKMRVSPIGNVGIDETTPLAKLHVVGGRTNGTVYNTIIAAGGVNSTDGSGARLILSGCENDPLARGTVIEGISTGTGNSHQLNFKTNNGSNTPSTRMTIGHTGNVGIGNTNPQHPFIVHLTDGEVAMFGSNGMNNTGQYAGIGLGQVIANGTGYQKIKIVAEGRSSGSYVSNLHFLVDTAADPNSAVLSDSKMMISGSNGHVGIGTTSPDAKLYVSGKDDAGASDLLALQFDNSPGDTGMTFRDIFSGIQSRFTIDSSNTNDLRISSGTQMHFYGGTSNGTGDGHLKINSSGHFTSVYGMIVSTATFAEVSNVGFGSYNSGAWVNSKSGTNGWLATAGNGVLRWSSGAVFVNGSLSKNSGSFKIPHPLPSKNSTHALVHSFIEGPQADNIYRGVVDLVNGTATINIDTVSGMTEGTYVLLNTNTSCFTSNETNWDAVKGSVSGNILTITCQNDSSTATVSWLVIGERHDQHMKDTDWTDSDGKVIVEPLKEQEVNLGD